MIARILFVMLLRNSFGFQMISAEDQHCDAEDADMARWFIQVNDFIHKNQNISQQIDKLYNKFEINEQQQQQCNLATENQLSTVLEKIQQLERKIAEIQEKNNGNIVIQRRQDGSVDFYRNWDEYKRGFGNETGEFFIGLEKLHKLTNSRPYELLIIMEDWENDRRYAKYDQFIVGSENEQYKLKSIGAYSGSAGDSLSSQVGQKFSTKDRDQDASSGEHCAELYKGAWWYSACHSSNLNGLYLKGSHTEFAISVIWLAFRGYNYSLKFVEMILVPK